MNEKRKQRFRLKRLINERCHAAFEQHWREQGLCPVPQEELEEMEVKHRPDDHFLSLLRERAEADHRVITHGQRCLEKSGDVEQDARGIWRHADGTFAPRDLIILMEGNPFVAAIEARIFEKKEADLESRIMEMLEKFQQAH